MKSSDRLLNLMELRVDKDCNGRVLVNFPDTYIADGGAYCGLFGRGETFEEACDDYMEQISGKTLVVHPGCENRKEIWVI